MAKTRIFLSHSSADRDFADALAKALREADADVWYDETHLGTGLLLREISSQLANRPVFIVLLSKEAFASHWVPRECQWAYDLYHSESGRTILPIIVEPLAMSDWYTMLWLREFRRISRARDEPFPQDEAISITLRLLKLAPADGSPASITSLSDLSDSFRAMLEASRLDPVSSSQSNIATHLSKGDLTEDTSPPAFSGDEIRQSMKSEAVQKEPLQSLNKYPSTWSTQDLDYTETVEPLEILCPTCGARNTPGSGICKACGGLLKPQQL